MNKETLWPLRYLETFSPQRSSEWFFTVSIHACWDNFNASRSLAAHGTICNITNYVFHMKTWYDLKMYGVLPLEVIVTISIFKILIYRFFSKCVFSDMHLIILTVMTLSKGYVPTVKPII